jgi:hypothetical protein
MYRLVLDTATVDFPTASEAVDACYRAVERGIRYALHPLDDDGQMKPALFATKAEREGGRS